MTAQAGQSDIEIKDHPDIRERLDAAEAAFTERDGYDLRHRLAAAVAAYMKPLPRDELRMGKR